MDIEGVFQNIYADIEKIHRRGEHVSSVVMTIELFNYLLTYIEVRGPGGEVDMDTVFGFPIEKTFRRIDNDKQFLVLSEDEGYALNCKEAHAKR